MLMRIYDTYVKYGVRLNEKESKYLQNRARALLPAIYKRLGPCWRVRLECSKKSEAAYFHIGNWSLNLDFCISIRNHGKFSKVTSWDAEILVGDFQDFWELRRFFLGSVLPRCLTLGFETYHYKQELAAWKECAAHK